MEPSLQLYLALLAADVGSSTEIISKGRAVEENPIVRQLTGTNKPSPEQFLGIGAGVGAGVSAAWPKLPEWLQAGLTGIEGAAAMHNTYYQNQKGAVPALSGAHAVGAILAELARQNIKRGSPVSVGPAAPLGAPGVGVSARF